MAQKSSSCTLCGSAMWKAPDAAALPVCRPCRRAHPMLGPKNPGRRHLVCPTCGGEFRTNAYAVRFCSIACSAASQRRPGYEDFERKQARAARDRAVGGLTEKGRRRLLARWRSAGRACAYCDEPATTVDHVIPLSRGGDNFEGNLVPACLTCNSRKKDRLLIEWRTGRCASSTFTRPRRKPNRKPPRKIGAVRGTQEILHVCDICHGLYCGPERITCGDKHCQREHSGRQLRDRYRASVGHPVDPAEPTLYWIRLHGLPDTRTRAPHKRKAVA